MAAIVNDRDVLLQAASVRKLTTTGVAVVPTPSSYNFYLRGDGTHGPDYVRISLTTILCDGPFTFAVQGAKLSNITATTADIAYADMTSSLAIVTVTAANAGTPVQGSCIIGLVSDGQSGQPGQPGTRGAGVYYATGGAWSDSVAKAACPGGVANAGDVVTISNGTTYALTKKYDGSAWVALGGVYDGSLFVTGSIQAAAINTNGLTVRDLQGNIIVGVGSALNPAYAAPGTLNSDIMIGGRNLWPDGSFERGIHQLTYRNNVMSLQVSNYAGATSGSKSLFLDTRSTDTYVYAGTDMPVTAGKTYTISFDYKIGAEAPLTGSSSYVLLKTASGTWLEHIAVPLVLTTDQAWRRTSMTFTVRADAGLLEPRFGIIGAGGSYAWLAVDSVKVEEGNKATAWTPATADVDAAVAQAATTSTWAGTTGAGKPQDNATVGADSSNLKTGTGRPNLLEKNTLPVDLSTFTSYFSVAGGAGPFIARGGADGFAVYGKDRRGCIYVHGPANPPAGTNIDMYRSDRIQIIAGKRYEFGVTLSTHRCKGFVDVAWYDSNGNYIGENAGSEVLNSFWQTGSTNPPTRSTLIITPPANAVSAMMFVRQLHTGEGDPYTFASQWYAAEALPGQTEPSPYSASPLEARDLAENAVTGLADKLSQTAGGVLQGQVVMQTSGAIVAGNASWGSAGYGGTGTVQSPYGFACVKGGVPTFAASVNGDVAYGGTLTGASGTFGALRIASGGYIAQNYYGTWDWAAKGPGPGFLIHPNGMLFGDYNDANYGYVQITSNGTIAMPGFDYSGRQLTLTSPVLVNPKTTTSFTASIAPVRITNQTPNVRVSTGIGVSLSGGSGASGYSYQWVFNSDTGGGSNAINATGLLSNASLSITAQCSAGWYYASASVTVTDIATGATARASVRISIQFGSGAEV